MSELINAESGHNDLRWKLLTSVSALALIGNLFVTLDAKADDAGQPTVWIELGGQLEQFASTQEPFSAPFLLKMPRPSFETVYPLNTEKPPRFAIGGNAKLTFEPAGTNLVFSASVRYGRSNGNKVVQQETLFPPIQFRPSASPVVPTDDNYATTKVRHDESHATIDFQAGKDVGLGLFGRNGTSTFSLGVRYAQLASRTTVDIRERPDLHTHKAPPKYRPQKYYHDYHLVGHSARSFHAVGPSLSWDASAPFAGNPESTEFTLEWGMKVAVLFGRQKAAVSHYTSGQYFKSKYRGQQFSPYANSPAPRNSARSVTIPNLGGFAGVSVEWPNAKMRLGYRADFFFGAVDGGIDKRVSKTLGLNGPYASISVGL